MKRFGRERKAGLIASMHSINNFTRYLHDQKNPNSISEGTVVTIADAGKDSLWIGTGSGLDLMDKRTGNFHSF
jgi:hypothetical protein